MSSSFAERKSIILNLLMEESSVSVSELAKRLNVTVVTARADLAVLEEEGLLVKADEACEYNGEAKKVCT